MSLQSNVPTLSYIRWVNLLVIYQDVVYQIYNNHTNKAFIYWDISSPYELICSSKKLEEKEGRFYIIFNQNGKYTVVPNDSIILNFADSSTASKSAVEDKILGFQNQIDTNKKNITTVQADVEGIKTTVTQVQEDIVSNTTNISELNQRADEISAEVNQITIDYGEDVAIRDLRDNVNMAILKLQSTLGLFSSDMNTYVEDNKLSETEKEEINAYKEELYSELSNMDVQVDEVLALLTDKGETEKVVKLTNAKESLTTSINNLCSNIDTACTDNIFTNNEIATIISYFGKANVQINEIKNYIDECIYLSLGGSLIEEIGKLIVKQDEIKLSVVKNEQTIRSSLNAEKTLVQEVIDNNILSLNDFRDYFNTISLDSAIVSSEIETFEIKINSITESFNEMKDKTNEILNNPLLSDEDKEKVNNVYTSYKNIYDNFIINVENIDKDGLISIEEQTLMNEFVEDYNDKINELNSVLFEALDIIGKNGVMTDIENVDKKWSEIILGEDGIQSQVGNLEKQVNDDGGILERLETAEQKITPDAIINTVSSTYYSKQEVDDKLENVEIGKVVTNVDVMYYISTSPTDLQDGSWITELEDVEAGYYIWTKTVTSYSDDTQTETQPICITGQKGESNYIWIKYSDNADGSDMYDVPNENTLYIGIGSNKESNVESTNPLDYEWCKFKGADGTNATPNYTWIRYADDEEGNGISNDPTDKAYIGFSYNRTTSTESDNPSDYKWSLIKGTDGVDGTSVKILGTYATIEELNSAHPNNEIGDGYMIEGYLYVWTGSKFENVGKIKGEDGTDGITLYTWIKYSDNADGSNMYDEPIDKTEYIGIATNKTSQTESTNPLDYKWSKFKGADGVDGESGKGIVTIIDYYRTYPSDIGLTNNSSGFSTTIPTMDETNKYLWSYELITYTDDTTTKTNARVIGVYSVDGNGIKNITEYYAIGTSNSDAPTTFNTSIPTMDSVNRFLWNYEIIEFTDETSKETNKRVIGVYGETGDEGRGIVSVTEEFYLSSSKTSQIEGEWVQTPPTWVEGKYMWTRSKITYTDNAIEYTTPVCDSSWEAVGDLQDQIDSNREEIETTKSTVAQHSIDLESITTKVESTESTVITLNGEIISLENRVSSAEQKITDESITNIVSTNFYTKSETDEIKEGLEDSISTVEQTANKINWVVSSGTSSSNMSLTSDAYNLIASNISLRGYVTLTDLAGSGTTTINGDNITSGTIKGVTIISTVNNLRRVKMINDGLYFYSDTKQAGEIHFDSNGDDTVGNAKDRFLISSCNDYVLKLYSHGDMSLEANEGMKNIYMEAENVNITNDLGVGGEIVSEKTGRFYEGISSDGEIYTTDNLRAGGTLTVGSTATFNGSISASGQISTTANLLVGTTLKVTGATTLESTLKVSGTSTLASLSATTATFSGAITGQSTMTLSGKLNGASAGFSGNVDVTGIIYGAGNIQLDNASTYFPAVNTSATANRLRLGNTLICATQSSVATSGVAVHFVTTSGGNGSIYAGQMYANNYNNLSDERAKTDIKYVKKNMQEGDSLGENDALLDTKQMLKFIEDLPLASYKLKQELEEGIDKTRYGIIIQDIEGTDVGEAMIVREENEDAFMKYSIDELLIFLCGATQQAVIERKELQSRIEQLENVFIDEINK